MTSFSIEPEETLERGFAAYFTGIDLTVDDTTWQTLGITRPDTDLQSLVDTHGAVIRVRRAGGTEEAKDGRPRLVFEVHAKTYSTAWKAATDVVKKRMTSTPFFRAGGYRIDKVRNESANTERPHPNLRVIESVWRITTRDPI